MTGFRFAERMAGAAAATGSRRKRAFAFDLEARSPTPLRLWGLTLAEARGTVDVDGLARAAPARGWLELSPFAERRMRYVLEFDGDDGRRYRFEGHKRIRPWSARSWTALHGEIRAEDGDVWGSASAWFSLRRQLGGLIASVRPWHADHPDEARAAELVARRWRGQRGRLEVWYATLSDPATGEGFWLHHELLAPQEGAPRWQGWAAAFPPGAPPIIERFAGTPGAAPPEPGPGVPAFAAGDVVVRPGGLRGEAGALRWDLRYADGGPPLFTFPETTWRRELLPAAQVVAAPAARFSGTIAVGGRTVSLDAAPGNLARIYGHGNAERWAWLHAGLGGGDVLEIVAAVSRRPGLNRLPPLSFVQLRLDGQDWPRRPLAAALALRTQLHDHAFTTTGRWGARRLRVEVRLDPAQSLTLHYDDTEGDGPDCTNSERASADIVLERHAGGRWHVERSWRLDRTAHAEIGVRGA